MLPIREMMGALCLDDESGGGSDSCDAGSFMCCHERRELEVLGKQLQWPGIICCNVVFLRILVFLLN